MSPAITTNQLTRTFGEVRAVDKLDLRVPEGCVYGFLGPNGSGKTTTVRMLLGLLRPTEGRACLFDRDIRSHRADVLGRVGSMVESPSLYGHLTGRENLEINRRLRQLPRPTIDRVLDLTDMTKDAHRPTKQYSLGMKQRLGLALALLGEPDLLILDEPTNGLDPAGIREIRELLRNLPVRTGATVFLSSHLLGEVQQIADHVGIIHNGRLLFEGSLRELQQAHQPQVEIEVGDVDRALAILQEADWSVAKTNGHFLIVTAEQGDCAPQVSRMLVERGIDLYQLRRVEPSLEAVFLGLTGSAGNEERAA
ncbi:ATP-binding cassette domain-containing protein [candidate division GN15 bacterium]|nr:ATP-binding cassette domain-containing protein [candidate division GN15 bacterium]